MGGGGKEKEFLGGGKKKVENRRLLVGRISQAPKLQPFGTEESTWRKAQCQHKKGTLLVKVN